MARAISFSMDKMYWNYNQHNYPYRGMHANIIIQDESLNAVFLQTLLQLASLSGMSAMQINRSCKWLKIIWCVTRHNVYE